ncbi:hypothetical protein Bca52824_023443 [Brassica carinata]|uniref:Uncharacterized protein n=1 Tax=Brassica carinata TaxID=52824 RepID=A0A8X7VIQ9_BRACI|nr:hypothetical protein Bca52824_023443 [Brassica carinata]
MNWMFSADQGFLKRVQRLELELEDLPNAQNHSQKSSMSIDGVTSTSIDTKPAPSTTYSKHEVDESLGDIWKELKQAKARLSSKLTKTCEPIFHNLGDLSICTEEMKRSIRLINEAHADMNPAAPCNPFGGLTRLKAAERELADIHFLLPRESAEEKSTDEQHVASPIYDFEICTRADLDKLADEGYGNPGVDDSKDDA